jgi:photosystem II stability/assembly factor-like uncharacterized protein
MFRALAIFVVALAACATPAAAPPVSPMPRATGPSSPTIAAPVLASPTAQPTPAPSSSTATRLGITHLAAIDGFTAAVAAFDANGPTMLVTVDAGVSWERRALPAGLQFVDDVRFASREAGWLIASMPAGATGGCTGIPLPGCDAVLFRSTDLGRSWTHVTSEPYVRHAIASGLAHLVAVDATHAWATTSHGCTDLDCVTDIGGTTDGRNWTTLGSLPSRVVSLDFVDADRGWATTISIPSASFDRVATARLYATQDGGRSWSAQFHATGITPQLSVEFVDPRHGWMLGNDVGGSCSMGGCADYSLYASDDAGENWARVQAPPDRGSARWWLPPLGSSGAGFLGGLTFATPTEGWISVSTGAGAAIGGILHTRDGGRSWTRFDADNTWSVQTIAAVPGAAWAMVGVYGAPRSPAIYRSTDGLRWDRVLEGSP